MAVAAGTVVAVVVGAAVEDGAGTTAVVVTATVEALVATVVTAGLIVLELDPHATAPSTTRTTLTTLMRALTGNLLRSLREDSRLTVAPLRPRRHSSRGTRSPVSSASAAIDAASAAPPALKPAICPSASR